MKKRYNIIKTIFGILTLIILSACQVGLGESVDLEAPAVKLTSHALSDYVAANFTLVGTVTDNESISSLTVDFEEADIHYKLDKKGKWLKKTSTSDWAELTDSNSSISATNTCWNWSIDVSALDAKEGSGSTFNFTILATDEIGNSSDSSKLVCSLIVDEELPSVSIIRPELDSVRTVLETNLQSYALKDGNVISRLFNGNILLEGRQDGASSFKELRIELDDGKTDNLTLYSTEGTENLAELSTEAISNAYPFDRSKIYYSKTYRTGENNITDLRTWVFSIPQAEWVTNEKNAELLEGNEIIRVVATSISSNGNWERKVLGYFVWWPEADTPWITMNSGSTTEENINLASVYPSSKIYGLAQDDDGIKSIKYDFDRKVDSVWEDYSSGDINLSEENAKSSQLALSVPNEISDYKVTITTTDIYGVDVQEVRYFKVLDVQPPKINLTSPIDGSSVITQDKKISFVGEIVDDGKIESCKIVYLNPSNLSPENKISYLNGGNSVWDKTGEDENGNIVYDLKLGKGVQESGSLNKKYAFEKEFDIFEHLKIGSKNNLTTQEFIIQVKDNGGLSNVLLISLVGDNEKPALSLDTMRLYESNKTARTDELDLQSVPNLPVLNEGDYVILKGTWSDNSTNIWNDASKINKINVTWGNVNGNVTKNGDGTWEAKLTHSSSSPLSSGSIKVDISDYANNKTTVTKAVFVEKEKAQLDRINVKEPNGFYKAGDKLTITLDFTKNVEHTGTNPKLKLNNGKTIDYKSGSGSARYEFEYTIADEDDKEKLLVEEIIFDGKWQDAKSKEEFTLEEPTDSNKNLISRSIVIDTTAPEIESIEITSSKGFYKKDSSIYFKLTFKEDVNITNPEDVKLVFDHKVGGENVKTESPNNGAKTMVLEYKILEDHNADNLVLSDIELNKQNIKDNAGNTLADYSLGNFTFDSGWVIDTTIPEKLEIETDVKDGEFIIGDKKVSFTLQNSEGDATVEYSLNGGTIWHQYNGEEVTLEDNGSYTIVARQTDKAGNISPISNSISFTIDNGKLINRIGTTTKNGTYSTKSNVNTINGYIEFRKVVTIEEGAEVTLNVKDKNGNFKTVSLNECTTSAASASKFTFDYPIKEGDFIDNNGVFDVKAFNFEYVVLSGKSIPVKIRDVASQDKISTTKQIKIDTVIPTIDSIDISGEGDNSVLTITYSEDIVKGSGSIILSQSVEDYRVPVILNLSEYNELKSKLGKVVDTDGDDTYVVDTYYKKGVNGAEIDKETNYLTPNTKTKYILDFEKENNNADLVELFRQKELHIVEIPVYVSNVSVQNENQLVVELKGAYALPVEGALYEIAISEGLVNDKVNNGSEESSEETITSKGVENPEIRIKKGQYEIINPGDNLNSDVIFPETAQMKISCRTPGATIKYAINEDSSNHVVVNNCGEFKTETKDVEAITPNTEYNETLTLGNSNLTFSSAKGMKFAISAQASKGTNTSDIVYEYAARTVLKFKIGDKYQNYRDTPNEMNDKNGNSLTDIKDGSKTLRFSQLTIWIEGGDAESGGNTIDPFPLSWGKPEGFKMMKLEGGDKDKTDVRGEWYWVTWDVSAPTYHGFHAGNVPEDAQSNGPSIWYAGECFYTPLKSNYILYPGETLMMTMDSDAKNPDGKNPGGESLTYNENNRSPYFFRLKNKGTR